MYLENIVVDAVDPPGLGRFWEAALGSQRLTDGADIFETRIAVDDGPELDLCFQPVPTRPDRPPRLHLDLEAGDRPEEVVARLVGAGAAHDEATRGQADETVLVDPEGNPFRIGAGAASGARSGDLAALRLESADPVRDADFWCFLSGWELADATTLRHPSGRGPLLRLVAERGPKSASKNRWHLDLRLEPGDDIASVAAQIASRGGRELPPLAEGLPWRLFADPSGNELCLLPARS